jgi:hypothetical protein
MLDAQDLGIHCMRQFVFKLRQDFATIRNAISELWSNGQTEGQINRLKTLKRAMYGRAGVELLRARMLPSQLAATQIEEGPRQMTETRVSCSLTPGEANVEGSVSRRGRCPLRRRPVKAGTTG